MLAKKSHLKIAAPFLSLIFVNLFWLFSSFPARLSPDSIDVISQGVSNSINNTHTVSYVYLVKIVGIGGNAIWLVSLFQLCLTTFSLYLFITVVSPRTPKERALLITAGLLATPFIGPIASTLWKDSVYNPLLLIGISLLIKSRANIKNSSFYYSTIVLCIASMFRHEAWISNIILCALLLIFSAISKTINLSKFVLPILVAAIIGPIASNAFVTISGAGPSAKWVSTSAFLKDLQHVNLTNPGTLNVSDRRLLDAISNGQSKENARDCTGASGIVFAEGFNSMLADKHYLEIGKMWLRNLLGDAGPLLMKAHICGVQAFLPPPISTGPSATFWINDEIVTPNVLEIGVKEIIPGVRLLSQAWIGIWSNNAKYIAWPGLHLLIIFLLCFNLRNVISRDALAIICFVSLARIVTFLIFATAQDFRFVQIVYMFSLPLIWLQFREKRR